MKTTTTHISVAQRIFFLALIVTLCASCDTDQDKQADNSPAEPMLVADTGLRYAKRFSISRNAHRVVICLFGKRDGRDTTARFVILTDSTARSAARRNEYLIRRPCRRIASLGSVYTNMFDVLGDLNSVVAIENIDYYTNPRVRDRFSKGEIVELSKGPEPDVERTLSLKPDIVFTFGMGYPDKEEESKIRMGGVPMAVALDHLEESPLARAEWIKFFAEFTGKRKTADSIFRQVEKNYVELKKLARHALKQPRVLTEIKLGEVWYVPGGKSFAATFISDANARYVWADNASTGSLQLSFEEVHSRAHDADFWLNLAMVRTVRELLAQDPRYGAFKAVAEGNLYNNIRNVNEKGFSDYWETGIIFPDRVLSDLIQIFHPELKMVMNEKELYYYKKLE